MHDNKNETIEKKIGENARNVLEIIKKHEKSKEDKKEKGEERE